MICPKCNKHCIDTIPACLFCGYKFDTPVSLQDNVEVETTLIKKSEPNETRSKANVFCYVISVILIVASLFFFYNGFDKKNNYFQNEYLPSSTKHAYVGGDAYNYIINANYFTGYMTIGTGLIICSSMFIGTGLLLSKKN